MYSISATIQETILKIYLFVDFSGFLLIVTIGLCYWQLSALLSRSQKSLFSLEYILSSFCLYYSIETSQINITNNHHVINCNRQILMLAYLSIFFNIHLPDLSAIFDRVDLFLLLDIFAPPAQFTSSFTVHL